MSELDPFQRTLQTRKQRIDEEDQPRFKKRPAMVGVSATKERPAVVRILGNPAEARSTPFDARAVLYSQILDDTGKKYSKIFWPMEVEHTVMHKLPSGLEVPVHTYDIERPLKEWILHEFMDAVLHGEWEEVEPGQGEFGRKKDLNKIFTHKGHPVWQRIRFNQKPDGKPRQFKYRKLVALNAIDRADSWCADNNHTKLLSAGVGESTNNKGETVVFVEPGLSLKAYNKILDNIVGSIGNWAMYDIILVRSKDDNDKETAVACIRDTAIPVIAKKIGKDGPTTAEELKYERYNLDEELAFTSYFKLKKTIGKAMLAWDRDHRTTFCENLDELIEIEKKERQAKKAETEPARSPQGTQTVSGNRTTGSKAAVPAKAAPPVHDEDDEEEEMDVDDDSDASLQEALARDDARFARAHQAAAPAEQAASVVEEEEEEEEVPPPPPKAATPPAATRQPSKRTPAGATPPAGKLPPTEENLTRFFPFWLKLKEVDRETLRDAVKHFNPDGGVDYNTDEIGECDNPECVYPNTDERTYTPMSLNNCPVCFTKYGQQ